MRAVDEGAGQAHALLLAATELRRIMLQAVAKTDAGEKLFRAFAHAVFAAQFGGDHHVLQRGEIREQLEILEDEPGVLIAEQRALVLVQLIQRHAIDPDRAARG